ncbi:NifB/NifX family molybdenum-iron cluster-binding protein [Sporohalobacter salinus]|uniref:NifB/NifX family molybdenum-iron cluster-binding protein n=1 Tax=Sporohalobacter salinus TaxID=1494606 RepID=UPI00196065BA|nr:NifB/NifX family molybdenum-iron cluster-binding protein [Sporohalobacter salinus]MBM7622699.1 putative Fe-Mo cluster-binding NifX family protein [Sporohalobacter salinus]
MKKIAVPTDGNNVAEHFGRCPEYTIVEIEGEKVNNKEVIDNPGHKPGFLPRYLNDQGVDIVLAGGMGRRAKDLFDENEIDAVTGVTGSVDEAIECYLAGDLDSEENICDH